MAILILSALATGAVREIDFAGVQILTVALLGFWLARIWVRKEHRTLWAPVCWAVAAFLVYAVIRCREATVEYLAREQLLKVLVYGALFFVILDNLNRQEHAQRFVIIMSVLGTALGLYAIYQFATNSKYVWYFIKPVQYMHRGSGTFICPNHLAAFLEMLLPLALAFGLTGRMNYPLKIFLGYASVAMLGGILATISRGGLFTTAIVLAVFFFFVVRQSRRRLPLLLLLVVVLGGSAFALKKFYHPERRIEPALIETGVDEIRLALWPAAIHVWKEHFWWGGGPGTFDFLYRKFRRSDIQLRPKYAHNDYLNTLADWGAVGGGLVLVAAGLVYLGFFQSWKYVRRSNDLGTRMSNRTAFVLGAGAGLLAIMVHSALDFSMQIPANALLAVALAAFGTGYLRYGTERFWVSQGLAAKVLASAILLAGIGYLGWQTPIRFAEGKILAAYDEHPNTPGPQAMKELQAAFAIDPANFEVASRIGDLLRADSATARFGAPLTFPQYRDEQGLAQAALQWYGRSKDLNPLDPDTYLRYGMCLDLLGRVKEANPWFEKASAMDPDNYYILACAGWHFAQAGEYLRGRGMLERSKRVLFRNPLAVYYLNKLAQTGPPAPAAHPQHPEAK